MARKYAYNQTLDLLLAMLSNAAEGNTEEAAKSLSEILEADTEADIDALNDLQAEAFQALQAMDDEDDEDEDEASDDEDEDDDTSEESEVEDDDDDEMDDDDSDEEEGGKNCKASAKTKAKKHAAAVMANLEALRPAKKKKRKK